MPPSPALLVAAIAARVSRLRALRGEALARALHDVKGLARLTGQTELAELAHRAEERLDAPGDALAALEDAARGLAGAAGPATITLGELLTTSATLAGSDVGVTRRGDALTVSVESERAVQIAVMLAHLIGNALDHGLAAGVAGGRIELSAHRDGDGLVLEVADNGRGVDRAAVRARALAAGLDPDDLLAALCHGGLTTRDAATPTAGRGQGLGAVRAAIDALGGTIEIVSSTDGVRVTLRMPRL